MFLVVGIHFHQPFVFGHIEVKFAFVFVRAGSAIRMAEGVVLAVKIKRAGSVHFGRIGFNPPVQQIKVMGCLVYPKRSTFLAKTVPAPEIVGAVAGIEIPMEINRCQITDLSTS